MNRSIWRPEANVANTSLTLTWSTSFHPVGPTKPDFVPSHPKIPFETCNLPFCLWPLCWISPASGGPSVSLSLSLSLSLSPFFSLCLFLLLSLPPLSFSIPNSLYFYLTLGLTFTIQQRVSLSLLLQRAWKGPEAEGEGEEPVVNQNRRSSESPSHLFESVRGPARGFVTIVYTSTFSRYRRAATIAPIDRSPTQDDEGDASRGRGRLTGRWVDFRVRATETGRRARWCFIASGALPSWSAIPALTLSRKKKTGIEQPVTEFRRAIAFIDRLFDRQWVIDDIRNCFPFMFSRFNADCFQRRCGNSVLWTIGKRHVCFYVTLHATNDNILPILCLFCIYCKFFITCYWDKHCHSETDFRLYIVRRWEGHWMFFLFFFETKIWYSFVNWSFQESRWSTL